MKTLPTLLAFLFIITGATSPNQLRGSDALPPVIATALHAKYVNGTGVLLSWTSPEQNAEVPFEILRSRDGIHFVPVGWVIDADSKVENNYRFWDTEVAPGAYHYRLRRIDGLKKAEVSETISLDVRPSMAVNMYVYSDRSTGNVNIGLLPGWRGELVGVEIVRQSGQPVSYFNYRIGAQPQVEITDLASGTYTVRINGSDRTITRHVIVR